MDVEAAIVRFRLTDAICVGLLASVTLKVSGVAVAVAVGVPVIAPVEALSESPAGNEPLVNVHVYGVVPPVAESATE